jgi:ATP-dependent Clp protease ATP-binding subunit ClpA
VFERFTERARQMVVLAQDEARALRHEHLGTEHLLLGLMRDPQGVAGPVLRESGLTVEDMRERIRAVAGEGGGTIRGQMPLTPEAKAALERALRESISFGSNYIDREHILLGILRDPGGVLGQVLDDAGCDIGAIVSRTRHSPGHPASAPLEVPNGSGQSDRFTVPARRVVAFAQDEARRLKHNYVGTEHILLGLLREEDGVAARVLDTIGVRLADVRAQVMRIVGVGDEVISGQMTFTPRAKKVLELALRQALSLGHTSIGTEHILLGVAQEAEGMGARILSDFDAGPERLRQDVVLTLSEPARRGTVARREPPHVVVPCPQCGQRLSYVEIDARPGDSFKAERKGTTTCSSCGSTFDVRYRIEWRSR